MKFPKTSRRKVVGGLTAAFPSLACCGQDPIHRAL